MNYLERTWCEIDLTSLEYNINLIARTAEKPLMAIVKANAYGHGDKQVATTLQRCGITHFGVSNLNEALMLRKHGITGTILILGYTPPEYAKTLARHRISQAVISLDYAKALNQAAATPVSVHLKLDTGMSRVGFFAQDTPPIEELLQTAALDNLQIDGVFSHFSCSDSFDADDQAYVAKQMLAFSQTVDALAAAGIHPTDVHLQNSGGIFNYETPFTNLARAGIILYGLLPSADVPSAALDLKPLLSMKTIVEQVKTIPKGTAVSYGRTFTTQSDRQVATLTVGYADGYSRLLSNRADVLIHGKRCPILGRVCMDQMVVDVTGLTVEMGDIATLIGIDGAETISVDELANHIGTINYEVVCGISRRVPRVYLKEGAVVEVIDDSTHII